MGERNFKVDFVELFGYPIYGEFFKGVHHFSHGPGRSLSASGGVVLLPGLSFYTPRRIQSLPEVFP